MKKVLKLLTFVFMLGMLGISTAFAGGRTHVNNIRITGLDNYRGLMMTVFYTSSRKPFLDNPAARPWVRSVLHISKPLEIHGNGKDILIPEANFMVAGFQKFNYVIAVVHSPYLDVVALKNKYGRQPLGQTHLDLSGEGSSSPFNYKDYFSIDIADMDRDDKGAGFHLHLSPRNPIFQPIEN